MGKTLPFVALLSLLCSVQSVALSIGMTRELGMAGELSDKVYLTAAFDNRSLVLSAGGSTGRESLYITAGLDWLPFSFALGQFLGCYAGTGAYAEFGETTAAGVRVPLGIKLMPVEILEIYLEAAPAMGFESDKRITVSPLALQAAAGFRISF